MVIDTVRRVSTLVPAGGTLVSVLAVGSLLASMMLVPVGVPAAPVTIEKVKVNGTGCRSDTVAVAMSADNTAFTVTYSAYTALAGPGTKNKDQRKACSITVRLAVPAQVTYAVTSVDHRGYAELHPGATAELASRYHFQGAGAPAHTRHTFADELQDNWQHTDPVPAGAAVFGACGKDRKLDIDTDLSVRSAQGDPLTSYITMDSTDSAVTATYRIAYRAC
jgi:hypothetical protein